MRETRRNSRRGASLRRQWLLVGLGGLIGLSGAAAAANPAGDSSAPGIDESEELLIGLRVPLLSPLFAKTPVAVVDGEPITLGDLTRLISAAHAERVEQATSAKKNYAELLQRAITRQLVIQEAKNIGFDELPDVESAVEEFGTRRLVVELVEEQLADLEPDPAEVEALYAKLAREFMLIALEFEREADAVAFREACDAGGDFRELGRRFVAEGRAAGDLESQQYAKLSDLLPRIAQAAYSLEVGSVSNIFTTEDDRYLIFYVADTRVYEDPEVRVEARKQLLDPMRREKADAYIAALIARYAAIDEKLLGEIDLEKRQSGLLWMREEEPVDFDALRADERVLASVDGAEPFEVTVGDLTRAIEKRLHHGIERAAEQRTLNSKKRPVLQDILLKKSGRLEAAQQGRDQSEAFLEAVREFENSLLWGMFLKRVIEPSIKIQEAELRAYYDAHLEQFSTPMMLRMTSLAFYERADAENALAKLQRGADFKWVSANSPGQLDKEEDRPALFDAAVMSWDALPEDLQRGTEGARVGDALVYAGDDGLQHVVVVDEVFPAAPRPYEATREELAEILYAQKGQAALEEWGDKLREAYETRIFVTGLDG